MHNWLTSGAFCATLKKGGLLLVLLAFLWGTHANRGWAQLDANRSGPGIEQREGAGARSHSSGTELPEWAAPSRASRSEQGGQQDQMRARMTDPPGDPDRDKVPLGGLEWLLLAGAGYGLFKLREE